MRTITETRQVAFLNELSDEMQEKAYQNWLNDIYSSNSYYFYDMYEIESDILSAYIKDVERDLHIDEIKIFENYGWNVLFNGWTHCNEEFLGFCLKRYSGNDEKLLVHILSDCEFFINMEIRNRYESTQYVDCEFPALFGSKQFDQRVDKIEKFILDAAEDFITDKRQNYETEMLTAMEWRTSFECFSDFSEANEIEYNTETAEVA